MENQTNTFKGPLTAILLILVGAFFYYQFDRSGSRNLTTFEDPVDGILFQYPESWNVVEYLNRYYLVKDADGEVKDVLQDVVDAGKTFIVVETSDDEFSQDLIRSLLDPAKMEVVKLNQLDVIKFVSHGYEVRGTSTPPTYLTYALSSPFVGKRSIWVTLHPYTATSSPEDAKAAEDIARTFNITKRELPGSNGTTTNDAQ